MHDIDLPFFVGTDGDRASGPDGLAAGEHAGICVLRTGGFDVSAIPTFRSFVLADICFSHAACGGSTLHVRSGSDWLLDQRPFRVETERFRSSGAFLLSAAVCVSDS